jgi:hypothetical protein
MRTSTRYVVAAFERVVRHDPVRQGGIRTADTLAYNPSTTPRRRKALKKWFS